MVWFWLSQILRKFRRPTTNPWHVIQGRKMTLRLPSGLGGGSLWDPALASVPSLHLSGSFPHAWVHSSHLNSLALALSSESLPYSSSRPSKNILIHSWWCLVDSVCLFSENSELIFLRTTLWHRAAEGP